MTSYITSSLKTNRPNIILVTFDALTARNMSVYGYHRETTPFISEWAKNASIFTMVEAASTYTPPTIASLMTGKRVWTHQLYQPHGYKIHKADTENIPLLLKKAGYYNIALIQNPLVPFREISNNFDFVIPNDFTIRDPLIMSINSKLYKYFADKIVIYDWLIREDFIFKRFLNFLIRSSPDSSITSNRIDVAFNKLTSIIQNKAPEPFFAWIHLYPPHWPYVPPKPFFGIYEDLPFDQGAAFYEIKEALRNHQHFTREVQPLVYKLQARYDEFIRHCDKEFEIFIEKLTEQITSNTIIILSSDHGESFYHDYLGHGGPDKNAHLYEHQTNIPLIIKLPNERGGSIIDVPVEQIDIAPTLLEIANIPVPQWIEGRSLLPIIQGKEFPSKPIFSMSTLHTPHGHEITSGSFAVWDGEYKLIHYLEDNKSLLFNIRDDPDEMNNIFNIKAGAHNRLLTLIKDNLENANKKIRMSK